ncbi:MAG TPA: pyridoxamine 5'-phosphate oxidase family protein [Acidimicrobiia bacterium]
MADLSEQGPGMGSGVNQRAQIKMTPDEVQAFLDEQRVATMCSINGDGSIHAVAMWYGFVDGAIAFETKAKSQKVKNLRRNPNLTAAFETGIEYNELRGVTLVGTASIIEDYDAMLPLGISVFERYQGPYSEEMRPFVDVMLNKRVVVKLDVQRTVTWDHRKLAQ